VTPPPAPPAAPAGYDVRALRAAEFPWADEVVFLNHASTGPIPERARRELEAFARERATPFRLADDRLLGILSAARERAARLLGAEVAEIALATNTSYGLNLAARMLPLGAGDIVLVSEGEFPANVHPWKNLADKGVRMELVPVTGEGWPDEEAMLARMADPRVKVLAISFVQFHTGYRADLDRLGAAARAAGTFLVVDAIQGIGQIPLDVRRTPVDILACGAQKWLLSPWGSGFMYVRRALVTELVSPFAGWMAFEGSADYTSLCDYDVPLHRDARRFELVTLPFQDFLGMNHALDLFEELGVPAIEVHLATILEPVLAWARRRGIRPVSPEGAHASGIVALPAAALPGALPALRAAGVIASLREGAIRLSPHCYNTIEEMERVAAVLDHSR
jgi:selenocysteine lyase/cysteine desulfurase